jgi:hypothetical protein
VSFPVGEYVFAPGKSCFEVEPEIIDIILLTEVYAVYMYWWADCNMIWIHLAFCPVLSPCCESWRWGIFVILFYHISDFVVI